MSQGSTLHSPKKEYLVLAFYKFFTIEDPEGEVLRQKAFLQERDVTSRIYIADHGINGQMCAAYEDAHAYMNWLADRPEYSDLAFKIHRYHEHVFPRLTIKTRKQLVALDQMPNMDLVGQHLSPAEWRQKLESDEDFFLIDVRNDYEWDVGHFEGAEKPPCQTFRDFPAYADEIEARYKKEPKPVLMYCTGGIRCELYSALLKERGIEEVYQLEGGVINYGAEEGVNHWNGKLFVFDDRLTVPIAEESEEEHAERIGRCHRCQTEVEDYYNCANMDCNKLFLSCRACLEELSGCCQGECATSGHVRPYHHQNPHKPFRKRYHYFKN